MPAGGGDDGAESGNVVQATSGVQASPTEDVGSGPGTGTVGGSHLPAPNEHMYVGRTASTSSCTRSLRAVHIKEPPETDARPSAASGPPTSTTDDEHGPLHQAIPVMPLALAIACCVMNILLPGIGLYSSAVRGFYFFSCLLKVKVKVKLGYITVRSKA